MQPVFVSPLIEPGTVVDGKYRINRIAGQGAMGSVWEATHLGLNQLVAIKFVSPMFARSAETRERFAREAQAVARLRSRHVVQVLDNGQLPDGTPYLVMEFLEGETLADLISRSAVLSLVDTARIVGQIARALSHAHGRGIVHRDLKPENIFLAESVDDEHPIAKVLDFGVAKLLDRSSGGSTLTGSMIGSPLYMSPEQAMGLAVDHRADVYALGALTFTMLTGRPMYLADTLNELVLKICTDLHPIPSISAINPEVPSAVDLWLQKICAREPIRRYPAAKDAAADFFASSGQIYAEGSTASTPSAPAYFERLLAREPEAGAHSLAQGTAEDIPTLMLLEQVKPSVRSRTWEDDSDRGPAIGRVTRDGTAGQRISVNTMVRIGRNKNSNPEPAFRSVSAQPPPHGNEARRSDPKSSASLFPARIQARATQQLVRLMSVVLVVTVLVLVVLVWVAVRK